jgi:hypothetical protein
MQPRRSFADAQETPKADFVAAHPPTSGNSSIRPIADAKRRALGDRGQSQHH